MRDLLLRSTASLVVTSLAIALTACGEVATAPMDQAFTAPSMNVSPNLNNFEIRSGSTTGYCGSAAGVFLPTSATVFGAGGSTNDLTAALLVYNPGWPSSPILGAAWIGPYAGSNDYGEALPGSYCFQEQFTVPSGASAGTLTMSVRADNYAQVYLNGTLVGEHAVKEGYSNVNWTQDLLVVTPVNVAIGLNTVKVVLVNIPIGVGNNYTTDNCVDGPQADSKYAFSAAAPAWSVSDCMNPTAVIYTGSVNYTPAPPGGTGNQGCSLGYWKNKGKNNAINQTKLNTVFTFPSSLNAKGNETFQRALESGGGGINALMRQAAAAYLNSVNVSYPLTSAQVVTQVNAALASGTYSTLSNTLDGYNNLHNAPICPK